jgi:hypothetical protein
MNRGTVILLGIVGGIIGVAVVRIFFLNSIQIMGWNMFWKNLSSLNFDMFKLIFKSATFGKCLVGFLAGAGAGGLLGVMFSRR